MYIVRRDHKCDSKNWEDEDANHQNQIDLDLSERIMYGVPR
jgi:hypothetical protein